MALSLNLLRAGRSTLILEKESFGGQIAKSPRVENLPSIKEISGLAFSDALYDQISGLGAEFDLGTVTKIEKLDNTFKVYTDSGEYEALYTAYLSNSTNFQTALSTPLSGYFFSGKAYDQGNFGHFWSSTWDYSSNMYSLKVYYSTYVYPSDSSGFYSGGSVRCVFGS